MNAKLISSEPMTKRLDSKRQDTLEKANNVCFDFRRKSLIFFLVFNTYGDLSNGQLLHTYGFLEEDNKFDRVFIPVDIVLQNCQEEVISKMISKSDFILESKRVV